MRDAMFHVLSPACTTSSRSSDRSSIAVRIEAVTVGAVARLTSKPRRLGPRPPSTAVRGPEMALPAPHAETRLDLCERESLPRSSDLGMAEKRLNVRQPQERVQQSAVTQVDLR